jgi:hypothetical protein
MTERSNESGVSAELLTQWKIEFLKGKFPQFLTTADYLEELIPLAYAKGLEDAAKACDDMMKDWDGETGYHCAEAIRNLPGAKQ